MDTGHKAMVIVEERIWNSSKKGCTQVVNYAISLLLPLENISTVAIADCCNL